PVTPFLRVILSRFLRNLRRPDIIAGSRDVTATDLQTLRVLGHPRLPPSATPRHRDGRRAHASGDVPAGARSGPRERGLRPAVPAAGRRPVRREPESPVQAPAVP